MAITSPSLAEQAGHLLTKEREAGGHTRRDMAQKMGVADTTLLELELGRANPTLSRLERVAEAYGLRLSLKVEKLRGRRAS